MIEIVFNSSAAGSLKAAQRFGKGNYPGPSPMSVFICRKDGTSATQKELDKAKKEIIEKERIAWERAVPLGGSSGDVFCFELALSMGTLSEDVFDIDRQSLLESLFYTYPDDSKKYIQDSVCKMKDSLRQIRMRLHQGEQLRIWYSNQPDELCGFYWFMDWLNQLGTDEKSIIFIKLPEWDFEEDETAIHRNSFGEVPKDAWHRYLSLQKMAFRSILQMCSMRWNQLVQESAALRAVVNGQLVSVSEDIYDSFIRREIDRLPDEFYETKLIGKVLEYQLGIGDYWIHRRIERMISTEELEAAALPEKGMPAYRRLLRKFHETD